MHATCHTYYIKCMHTHYNDHIRIGLLTAYIQTAYLLHTCYIHWCNIYTYCIILLHTSCIYILHTCTIENLYMQLTYTTYILYSYILHTYYMLVCILTIYILYTYILHILILQIYTHSEGPPYGGTSLTTDSLSRRSLTRRESACKILSDRQMLEKKKLALKRARRLWQ